MSEKIDKLERGEFIEFVKGLILNSKQYKRDNESDSYVIALDSAWGMGKSYFIDLLTQSVTDDTLRIVKYNAWKNDYCENAFEPLIYDILTSDCLSFSIENDSDKENIKDILTQIGKIGLAFGKQVLTHKLKETTGIDYEKVLTEIENSGNTLKAFMLRESKILAEINQERDAFEKFKQYLSESTSYLKDNNKKLVVIVDELDRCKPTFAIQTLEVVKHLFDIENIVFLFAVDIQQLSHSISSIYGQGFDSVGYLCRFFDYIAKMPEPNISNYILESISSIETLEGMSDISIYHGDKQKRFYDILQIFFQQIYEVFDFSLRDMDTVIQSYKIMVNNFLFNHDNIEAHMIYIFFLSLKYKQPNLFNLIFINKSPNKNYTENEIFKRLHQYFRKNVCIQSALNFIYKREQLCECTFNLDKEGVPFKIVRLGDRGYLQVAHFHNGYWMESSQLINILGRSLSNVLFFYDLKVWDDIKNMTYREYIHKQLEMYNFFNVETEE